ncbi:hypothetical protein ACQEU6_20830 [Spirillospora sp. CA-108201]
MNDLTGVIGRRPQPYLEFEVGVAAPPFHGDERNTYAAPTAKTVEGAMSGIYADLSSTAQDRVRDVAMELIGIAKGDWRPMPWVIDSSGPAYTVTLGWFENEGHYPYPLITVFSRDPELPEMPDAAGSLRNWVARLITRTFRCGAIGHGGRGKTFWAVVDFQESLPTA